jgi:hypothetical protein
LGAEHGIEQKPPPRRQRDTAHGTAIAEHQ